MTVWRCGLSRLRCAKAEPLLRSMQRIPLAGCDCTAVEWLQRQWLYVVEAARTMEQAVR